MYLIATVPEDITKKLDEIINKKHTEKANHDLAGNIQNEFLIPEGKPIIWPLIDKCIQAHFDKFPTYYARISGMHKSDEFHLELHSLWVNYQKKYEFNPLHTHSGFVSFVIFMSIPYNLQDEEDMFKEANNKQASKFGFFSPDHRHPGGIHMVSLNVDKSYVGKMIMFKSSQVHGVYPFYTSNDYRITISGNLVFKVTN